LEENTRIGYATDSSKKKCHRFWDFVSKVFYFSTFLYLRF